MFKKLRQDELVRGSVVLFAMITVFNILNYVFQISMARMLGPADYGILAVLMSFIYIFGIPNEAIQTIISKYTSKFNIKKEYGKMKDLASRSLKKGLFLAVITFIIFLPVAYLLSYLLEISFFLIALTGLFIFYVFSVPIVRGIMQGRKKFLGLGGSMVIEGLVKVIASIGLVFYGWSVYGAMLGILIAGMIVFLAVFLWLKEILSSKRETEDFAGIYIENWPILIAITSVILMYSLDIILARRFFPPAEAGVYAFTSLIGKSILFVSMAIGKTMFPLSSEKFHAGKQTASLFNHSMLIVSSIAGIALLLFLIFPETLIKLVSLGSENYIAGSKILFILGGAFTFMALANNIVTYRISINKARSSYALLLFVILEVILLVIFNSNLFQFSISLLVSSAIMFLYSLFLLKK